MTFPSGPSGNSGNNSGFGSPRPGFGSPGGGSGGFGTPPSFGAGSPQSSGSTARPAFGGAPSPQPGQPQPSSQPPQQPKPTQYSAPTPAKGKGRFSGAIAALMAILLVLAIVLGVGAWFIWGRDSSGTGQEGSSSEPTTTATLEGAPLATSGSIETDLAAQDAVIARTLYPNSYVSQSGSTNIADITLAEAQSQILAVFGFTDDRANTDVASATVTVTGGDQTELATFEVPADEALEMPINVGEHRALRFTMTYKDSDGNPADNTGFAMASLHAQ